MPAHDAAHFAAGIILAATTLVAAGAPATPLADESVVMIASGMGLIGGIVATLAEQGIVTGRELILRCLASTLASVALVILVFFLSKAPPTFLYVFGVSCASGIFAWPLYHAARPMVPSIVETIARSLRAAIRGLAGGKRVD